MSEVHAVAEKIITSVFGEKPKQAVQVFMDPVSVVLNLWASQKRHEQEASLLEVSVGMVKASDVYLRIPVDEDWAAIPDPPDYREEGDGSMPKEKRVCERSDAEYDATPGKYGAYSGPQFDWTVLSACEVVEWALTQYTGDPDALERLLLAVHPDAGKYAPSDYPKDPFEYHARIALDDGASYYDVKGFAKIQRGTYGAFRKIVWQSIGSKTYQDRLALMKEQAEYVERRKHLNKLDAQELKKLLGQ